MKRRKPHIEDRELEIQLYEQSIRARNPELGQ